MESKMMGIKISINKTCFELIEKLVRLYATHNRECRVHQSSSFFFSPSAFPLCLKDRRKLLRYSANSFATHFTFFYGFCFHVPISNKVRII